MLPPIPPRIRTALRTIAVGLVLPAVLGLGSAAAAAPDPQLSITLTAGVDTVAGGEDLTYTAEIRNSGADVDARVVLASPDYIALGNTQEAAVEENEATWSLLLEGASTTTLEIPAHVAEIPAGEVRATAVISVYVGDATAPLIRTAAATGIEGVADEQVVVPSTGAIILWVGAGVVLVLAATAAALLVLRPRRSRAPSATPDDGASEA